LPLPQHAHASRRPDRAGRADRPESTSAKPAGGASFDARPRTSRRIRTARRSRACGWVVVVRSSAARNCDRIRVRARWPPPSAKALRMVGGVPGSRRLNCRATARRSHHKRANFFHSARALKLLPLASFGRPQHRPERGPSVSMELSRAAPPSATQSTEQRPRLGNVIKPSTRVAIVKPRTLWEEERRLLHWLGSTRGPAARAPHPYICSRARDFTTTIGLGARGGPAPGPTSLSERSRLDRSARIS